ncbi:hypothetical protein RFI_00853, partial [Reticulomyxa filosa]
FESIFFVSLSLFLFSPQSCWRRKIVVHNRRLTSNFFQILLDVAVSSCSKVYLNDEGCLNKFFFIFFLWENRNNHCQYGFHSYWTLLLIHAQSALWKSIGTKIVNKGQTMVERRLKKKKKASSLIKKKEYMVKSIGSLQEGNTKQLFLQFRSINSNKITVISAIVLHKTNQIARSDILQLLRSPNWNEHHQSEITEEEVIEALRHISVNKAQGPDNIHNQMIKNGGQAMIDSLVLLFDWNFRVGYAQIMKECKHCSNTRDHSICKNYRPIALLFCVGKLLERIIAMRLIWYLNENNLF